MRHLLLLCLLATAVHAADGADVTVFEAKKNTSYSSVRIPALLRTKKGTLIAVAEGRDKSADQAGNDLIVSTSKDDGATWSAPKLAYDQGKDSCNNPTLVEDELVAHGVRVETATAVSSIACARAQDTSPTTKPGSCLRLRSVSLSRSSSA